MLRSKLQELLSKHRDNDTRVSIRLEGHGTGEIWTDIEKVVYNSENDQIEIVVSPVLIPAYDAHTLLEVAEECGPEVVAGLYALLKNNLQMRLG